MSDWQFGDLQMFGYDLLVVDPPWRFELYNEETGSAKGAAAHYATMDLEEIKALRVGDLASGDCLLLLWSTGCMLPQCLDVMKAWGFAYKTELVWNKRTRSGKWRVGPGYRARTIHEPVLLGTIGNPRHRAFPSAFDGIAREHSRKPEEFYEIVDQCCPDLKGRGDIFARTNHPNYASWGNQIHLFPSAPSEEAGTTSPPPVAARSRSSEAA